MLNLAFVLTTGPRPSAMLSTVVSILVAILVYALIAWVRFKAVGLVLGDTRRDVRTTSRQIDTRVSSAAIVNYKDTEKGGDTCAK